MDTYVYICTHIYKWFAALHQQVPPVCAYICIGIYIHTYRCIDINIHIYKYVYIFWFILWWSSSLCVCMLNRCFRRYSQVFKTPLHAYVEEGWVRFFQLVYGWRLFGIRVADGSVSPFFTGGWCSCVVCVCVRTHAHTACGVIRCEHGCRDETPGEPGRNPDVL